MLTFEQLKKYFPVDATRFPKNMLVEYVQCELLDSLFKQKESVHLSFIGGTALRIVYGGNRFSEDLDFDNFGLSFEMFSDLTEKVADDMRLKGFLVDFRLVEKNAFHCYLKFPEILHNSGMSQLAEERILVRIDTMRKDRIFEPEVYTLSAFDLYRDILVNPIDILLSQKLITILGRKQEKGRDFYDVSVLCGRTKPNFDYIQKVSTLKKELFLSKILKRCETLDFDALAKDVEPFLVDGEQTARVRTFLPFIRKEFEKFLR